MLGIEKVDHVGIRVTDKQTSIDFYEGLGFKTLTDIGFEKGHPVIMQHPSGVVLNLLGPATSGAKENVLMDIEDKHPGITHVSFKIDSMEDAKTFLAERQISLTGEFSFKGLHAIFIRDPDRNVIELDAYVGDDPETRAGQPKETIESYRSHPD